MKYIKKFNSISEANAEGAEGLYNPHISSINGVSGVNIVHVSDNAEKFTCSFDSSTGKVDPESVDRLIPNNEIWYTSTDGQPISNFDEASSFGTGITLVSNTYENGKGIAKYSGDVTVIGSTTFYNCSGLTSITIPISVTLINIRAFYGCSSLTKLKIFVSPSIMTSFEDNALKNCPLLSEIEIIGKSIINFSSSCFDINNSLPIENNIRYTSLTKEHNPYIIGVTDRTKTNYVINENTRYIGLNAFNSCSSMTSCVIPDNVLSINNYAFSGCSSMTSCTIGSSVIAIGQYAFSICTALESITIPKSVISFNLEQPAFGGCLALRSISVEEGNPVYDSRNNCNAIIETGTNRLIQGCKNTVIPSTIETIWRYAFYNCSGLTSITIPDSVTNIMYAAFYGCSGLTSITIPDSVTSIGVYAFYRCSGLTSITIPDSVTSIGGYAFYSCYSLSSVTVEATTPPQLSWDVFKYNKSDRKIYVPAESVDAYKAATNWSTYADVIEAIPTE